MPTIIQPFCESNLSRIEPDGRLVVLARTMQAHNPEAESALKFNVLIWTRLGDTCLGQALYRHRTIFQNASEALVWSNFELSYFRGLVPADAILDLVVKPQPAGADLLRAEILLTTPSSFVLPRDWRGSADRPGWRASLEYIDVGTTYLGEYRNVMRDYCEPAAARLVQANRFGTFRAMETAAVLHRDPGLNVDWNQIHLCELDPNGLNGFGEEFEAARGELSPDGAGVSGAFAGLDRIRAVPRWTSNDPVVEADAGIVRFGATRDVSGTA